jgi:hypothetical protein
LLKVTSLTWPCFSWGKCIFSVRGWSSERRNYAIFHNTVFSLFWMFTRSCCVSMSDEGKPVMLGYFSLDTGMSLKYREHCFNQC